LEYDAIYQVALEEEELLEYMAKINEELTNILEKGDKDVLVVITMNEEAKSSINISTRPALEDIDSDKLKSKLEKVKSPRTKMMDYSYLIIVHINEGATGESAFVPKLILPQEAKMIAYEKLTLKEKYEYIKKWAKEEIIPAISYLEINVDKSFEGVQNIGNMLEDHSYMKESVASQTSLNYDYWRASMEMEAGNQLIPFTRAMIHLSKGEFDLATNMLQVINIFSNEGTLSSFYAEFIGTQMRIFED
jgi:hypothetical protein